MTVLKFNWIISRLTAMGWELVDCVPAEQFAQCKKGGLKIKVGRKN
ncbi:MAG: hypothetical protein KAG26_03845 [Methylococcales bacterium]|nr:hypothetical protein [Methylococcales bacterium]